MASVAVDGRSRGREKVLCLLSLYLSYCGSKLARSGRDGGGGGASAVEAGQSCSRHQGRHFLCREREREGEIEGMISDDML